MAMIRGVNCALASWTAKSIAEDTSTTNVNVEAATVPMIKRAVSGLILARQPIASSKRVSNWTAIKARTMARVGKIQRELRKYRRRRYRVSQLMAIAIVCGIEKARITRLSSDD